MNMKKTYPNYFWIVPFAIYTILFILPGLLGLIYSFTNWTIYSSTKSFAGLENYTNLLNDSLFKTGLKNTLLFALITTVFKNVFGFALALALNTKLKTKNLLRTVYFLPMVLSTLIVGIIFKSIFMPDTGLLNVFFSFFSTNLSSTDWLGNPAYAMWMVILVEIWRGTGYCMVIFLAGLQVISKDYYESATIDGANNWQQFKSITLPMMIPALNVNILLSIINGLKVFDIVIALTGGGPGLSTEVLSTGIYKYMGNGALATGGAANIVLTLFVVAVFAVINGVFSKLEVER